MTLLPGYARGRRAPGKGKWHRWTSSRFEAPVSLCKLLPGGPARPPDKFAAAVPPWKACRTCRSRARKLQIQAALDIDASIETIQGTA